MNIRYVDLISIPVRDQQVARTFYVDTLSFEVLRDEPYYPDPESGARWIEIAPQGAQTRIVLVTWMPDLAAGSVKGLALETRDIEADYAILQERGVEMTPLETMGWGGKLTTFRDPDGNSWVLQQSS